MGRGVLFISRLAALQAIRRIDMVGLLFILHGQTKEIVVPLHEARRVHKQLCLEGAVVFWSWRC